MANIAILHLTPKWSDHIYEDLRLETHPWEPLCFVSKSGDGFSALLVWKVNGQYPYSVSFPVRYGSMEGERVGDGYVMKCWGLRKIGPGTWAVDPSIHQPNLVHAYVVLCEVPEPAPWEVTSA